MKEILGDVEMKSDEKVNYDLVPKDLQPL